MDTNRLKRFAQQARLKLREQVNARLGYVLTHDTAALRERRETLDALNAEMQKLGRDALVDKVAYTWFNRLVALRYMDAREYQPLGIKILSPVKGQVSPQILSEAHTGRIPQALPVDRQRVFDILDGKISVNNPDNAVFRLLLVAACNHLNLSFPFLFERINDYTELLLPEDLTSAFSIVSDVVKGMQDEDCGDVEVIGWLYQFYISDRKDEVFAQKSKVKKEDIPAATQLFTPRWIVEYMVQNTLGKLWLKSHPSSRLREYMAYYLESGAPDDAYLKIANPEELSLLDPACGSGHILVYAFDLLYKIYEEQGYARNEITERILKHNLQGIEIDERAAQLSGFALMMKAREYDPAAFSRNISPRVLCLGAGKTASQTCIPVLRAAGIECSRELLHDIETMQQADSFGSLILPHSSPNERLQAIQKLEQKQGKGLFDNDIILELLELLRQLNILGNPYTAVVTNPPYMGGGNMNKELADFVKSNYPDSKADMMACFMESTLKMTRTNGLMGMINQHSWMFLSSYEALRTKLIDTVFIDTLLHLGPRTFPEIGGEVVQNAAFTLLKAKKDAKGAYVRLVDFDRSDLKNEKTLEAIRNPACGWFFTANQHDFKKIPGSPIGYWASKSIVDSFEQKKLGSILTTREGMATADNDRFMRYWHEVGYSSISYGCKNLIEFHQSGLKWLPYIKGGGYRRWFGNLDFIVNWENDGYEIKRNIDNNTGRIRSHNYNGDYSLRAGVSWSGLTSSEFSIRDVEVGFLFDAKGPMGFVDKKETKNSILGFLNSKVAAEYLRILAPTLDYKLGHILNLPFIVNHEFNVIDCIQISKQDWNSREASWDFKKNELIRINGQDIQKSYDLYQQYWEKQFSQLHNNEEELNQQFIELYGLQDELAPDVPLEDITIIKEETNIKDGQLVFHADEVFAQFISYSVVCMFGRYSLDKDGLILASQGETIHDYDDKVVGNSVYFEKTESPNQFIAKYRKITYEPDADNVIPVLDDTWFGDDIVSRFHSFLKAAFSAERFTENLDFVQESLGKDIRSYFVRDFYADHIKRYKKRPIYWMFASPKGHFRVLIYMHRYTPDTLSIILNNYLKPFTGKLEMQREHMKGLEARGSASEQNKARKEMGRLDEMLADCKEYERDILYPLAAERISIDLDDGVLVNYNKFGRAVAEVPGLNDAKTKQKVREFDWIDTSKII